MATLTCPAAPTAEGPWRELAVRGVLEQRRGAGAPSVRVSPVFLAHAARHTRRGRTSVDALASALREWGCPPLAGELARYLGDNDQWGPLAVA